MPSLFMLRPAGSLKHHITGSLIMLLMLPITRSFRLGCAFGRRVSTSCLRSISSDMDELLNDVVMNKNFSQAPDNTSQGKADDSGCWMSMKWDKRLTDNMPASKPSPVEVVMIEDRLVYFKRDDQLRLPGSQVSGNKARKMLALNNLHPSEFPECVVSYGGPQSNAMVALAAVVRHKSDQAAKEGRERYRFVYYTKTLPRFLKNQPSGNLFRAMSLGMELVELSPPDYAQLFGGDRGGSQEPPNALCPLIPGKSLWIPQGGASVMALAGARQLASEISEFWSTRGEGQPLLVFVPGGTCTTALLLHYAMREQARDQNGLHGHDIDVVVVPCVGDEDYARRQMMSLNAALGIEATSDVPTILPPAPSYSSSALAGSSDSCNQYFKFGEPDARIIETFRRMEDEHEISVDLLYNAPALTVMLRHWRTTFDSDPVYADKAIMYVHSGGIEGVNSQLLRYKHKGLVDLDEIQLPGRNR